MYLISYDISENKRRNKIFKELKNYGRHVQFSVFECEIDKKRYRQLYASLLHLMDGCEEGNIRIYQICANCRKTIYTIGNPTERTGAADEQDTIVI